MIRKQLFIFTSLIFLLVAGFLYAGPNQWTLSEGMYPIGAFQISMSPSNNNILYAVCGFKASPQYLFKSTDRGNTWSQVSNINTSWYYVYAAPEDSSTIYLINILRSGVYKSTDKGNTVTLYTTGISSTARITDLCITDTTGTLLLGGKFVYKSTDGGETWSPASTGMGDVSYINFSVSPMNSSLIYATGGNGLYKTIDGGNHWSLLTSSSNLYEWRCIRVNPVNTNIVYAIPGSNNYYLHKSIDGGTTWSLKSTGLPAWMLLDIVTVPGDGSTLFTTSPSGNGVYISTDTGETWQEMNNGFSGYPPYIVKLLVIPGKSPIILAATPYGVYSYTLTTTSVDKKQWEIYEENK
jgi:photosystem II stability/assembly factor-like uncharacterized protein